MNWSALIGMGFGWVVPAVLAAPFAIPPDGQPQAALVYVHGFNDDGATWARGKHTDTPPPSSSALSGTWFHEYQTKPPLSPSTLFSQEGIPNWAVQWWGTAKTGSGLPSGNTTAENGYAFLQSAQELLD